MGTPGCACRSSRTDLPGLPARGSLRDGAVCGSCRGVFDLEDAAGARSGNAEARDGAAAAPGADAAGAAAAIVR